MARNSAAIGSVVAATVAMVAAAVVLVGCEDARQAAPVRPAALAAAADAPELAVPKTLSAEGAPHSVLGPSAGRGKYIVEIGGCNDCHTPEFAPRNGDVPESTWLTGVPVGFKGPWGTTYPSNLRLFFKDMSEDLWVQVARSRSTRPPMVWPSLHAMSDDDLRSIYRYIKSLPVMGTTMPAYVPPGVEPTTAYVDLMPQPPKTIAADAR